MLSSESLVLRSERTLYRAGETITLTLVNDSTITYGSVADCTTPTVVWLRGENGTTYFTTSGDADSCGKDPRALSPGQGAPIASVDSRMVWVDQTENDKLVRLPQALPTGRYTVHALTSRGELVANLVLAD